ncbi:MAG: hypothetical protein KTR16_04205 [Acidiferrobacterales bacterium]|nr:hypothetical protein [Acidiferrobacterales bacterium]
MNIWSGSAALSSLDQSLQTIRNEVVRLDSQLSHLTQSVANSELHRNKLINDIAKVRLSAIEEGDLLTTMSAADHDALAILDKREAAIVALSEEIESKNQQILTAEAEREAILAKLNEASQAIVDLEAGVQAQLTEDKQYLAMLKDASEAESIASESSDKVELALEDMNEKAKPYKADDLFMYLYDRGFGTTEYKGGLFARSIDGWVAKLISYEDARINYWNLTEIPKRLEQHAQQAINVADEASMAVQQYELDSLDKAGITQAKSTEETLRQELDQFDDDLEEIEAELNQKLEERAAFAAGQDDFLQTSLQRLSTALQHKELDSVHRYVRATVSPTDDRIVLELQALENQLDSVEEDLADIRRMHDNKIGRLKELEKVRRNFKNSRFDDVRSGFGNKALLTSVLAQFLQGVASGSDVWQVIKRNQRYRNVGSLPDFGSGGLGRGRIGHDSLRDIADILGGGVAGRTRQGSTWNWPKPRRGGGGFRFPSGGGRSRGRSRSSGGFKTGGGF